MTLSLVGIAALAVLFAVFGLVRRERACDGACPGCGIGCAQWTRPHGTLREVDRGET